MKEDNEKKIRYLADVIEDRINSSNIKVSVTNMHRKFNQSRDYHGQKKFFLKLGN